MFPLDIGDPVSCLAACLIFKVPSVVVSLCGALGIPTGGIIGNSRSSGFSASTRAHVEASKCGVRDEHAQLSKTPRNTGPGGFFGSAFSFHAMERSCLAPRGK